MTLVAAVVAGVIVLWGIAWWHQQRALNRVLSRLSAEWGQPRAEPLAGPAGHYHRFVRQPQESIDDATWTDLTLDQVFEWMDRTESVFGREVLYDRLRRASADPTSLLEFDETVERFRHDEGARQGVQLACAAIEERHPTVGWRLVLEPPDQLPRWAFLFPLFSLLLGALLALTLVSPDWLPALVGAICVGLVLRAKIGWRITAVIRPLRAAARLTVAASAIAAIQPPLQGVGNLRSAARALRRLSRIASWLGRDQGRLDLGGLVLDYLNLLFCLDAAALLFAHMEVPRRQPELRAVAEIVGDLEAAIAVASVRTGSSGCVRPDFENRAGVLRIDGLRHPLVRGCVPNSVQLLPGEGMLLTGANMTGKSTFLRALGTNIVLAQSVHTAFAERYCAPWLQVRSCISPSDDLLAARSLYQREAETVVSMLADARSCAMLCLFDELFRGTNAHDRLGATAAVVRYLLGVDDGQTECGSPSVFVVLATHDLELVPLLADRVRAFHFGDAVTQQGLEFDYRLQPGPTSSRNAIALLEFLGAPRALVEEATALANRTSRSMT